MLPPSVTLPDDWRHPAAVLSPILEGVEVTRCKHHYVFYQNRDKMPVLIFAALHEKMDLMTRLRNRLEL